jgi:hypothetical protein
MAYAVKPNQGRLGAQPLDLPSPENRKDFDICSLLGVPPTLVSGPDLNLLTDSFFQHLPARHSNILIFRCFLSILKHLGTHCFKRPLE